MRRLNFEYYTTLILFVVSLVFMSIQGSTWLIMSVALGVSFVALKVWHQREIKRQEKMAQIDLRRCLVLLKAGNYNQVPIIMSIICSLRLPVEDIAAAMEILNNTATTAPNEFLSAYQRALEEFYYLNEDEFKNNADS
jgi:hypothetical protein